MAISFAFLQGAEKSVKKLTEKVKPENTGFSTKIQAVDAIF
jgi:hypothetical protein